MKLIASIMLATFLTFEFAVGLIVDKPSCGPRFYCPDKCNMTWRHGCPHNCYCTPIKYCPLVTCPAAYPICLIFTMFDGCQSCACKVPFAFIKMNQSIDEVNVMYKDAGHLRHMQEGANVTDEGGKEVTVAKKMMCTIDGMTRVDLCLRSTLAFHNFARDLKRDDQILSINPMIMLGDRHMKWLCKMYANAVECMGARIYEDCRRDHPDLSEMHSLLSYACGGKSTHFFQHFPCILEVHRLNGRMQLCEELLVNSLISIQETQVGMEKKQIHKCRALNWFLNCARPNVHRLCSAAAARVYAESFMSATEYMAPECNPDFENESISIKNTHHTNFTLSLQKEPLNCAISHQFSIFAMFDSLYKEIRSLSSTATPGFPVVYSYKKSVLQQTCREFTNSFYQLPIDIRLGCGGNFEVFDQVYGVFLYPCAMETGLKFFQHFECLKSLKRSKSTLECEEEADRHLGDPSIDQCETFQLLVQCMHEIVERKCGHEAWDTHSQLLQVMVRRYIPDCLLTLV